MVKPEPCPFCGKTESVRIKIYPNKYTLEIEKYSVVCDHRHGGCGSESGHYNDPENAIKYWNRRKGNNDALTKLGVKDGRII